MRSCLFLIFIVGAISQQFIPEETAQVEVVDAQEGPNEGIYIKVNGAHKDSHEQVYMQVNMNVKIFNGNVLVNDQVLPFSELSKLEIQAQLTEVKDGVDKNFMDAKVQVNFFLHELTEAEQGQVARAFRLECQIIETDQYDVHMFNVTEVVMHVDTSNTEIKRTVTMISESESKIHKAKACPMPDCVNIDGCLFYKKDDAGCQTCECAAMECPMMKCLAIEGCTAYKKDKWGCRTCECAAMETYTTPYATDEPRIVSCFHRGKDLGQKIVRSFEELPLSLQIITFVLLGCIAGILTLTCCFKVCCRAGAKKSCNNKSKNLKAYGCGKLQIYVADNEKKHPLIDNLDVVSADIA